MKNLLTLVMLLSGCSIFAQSKITGTLLDSDQQPIVAANALLLNPTDSSLIEGHLVMEGNLDIPCTQKSVLLQLQSLGFEDTFYMIDCSAPSDLGTVIMQTSSLALETVEVVGKRAQQFKMKEGILEVDVENSSLSSVGTVLDILRSTPGVMVTANDQVEIFGKGQARIFLDGQEIDDPNIIQSINSDDIKSIEVIRNPSAKYDAQGRGGIININTRNASLEGTLYNLRTNVTRAKYWRAYMGGTMSYRKKNFDLFLSLDYNPYRVYEDEDYERLVGIGNNPVSLVNDVEMANGGWLNSNYNIKLGYKVNDNNKVKLNYRGRLFSGNNDRDNKNRVSRGDTLLSNLLSKTDEEENYNYHIIDGSYQYADSLDNVVNLSLSNTIYGYEDEDQIREELEGGGQFQRLGVGMNDINILIAKADIENPILDRSWKLKYGLKYSDTRNNSTNQFFNRQQGEWLADNDLKNTLDYSEQNYAAYGSINKSWNKWSFTAGARYEGTEAEATSFQSGNYLDTTYHLVFKNANVEYNLSEAINFNLAYSERIQRPNFQDLDPFVEYLDSFSILKGNATLRPELVQNLEFTGSYEGYPLLTFGYSYTDNPITLVVEKDRENPLVNVGINRNLEWSRAWSGQIILPYQNDWWTSANGFGWTRNIVSYDQFNDGEDFEKDQYFIFSNQDFNLKGGWNLGALFVWFSPGVDGVFEFESGSFLNLWVGKKFMDGKWNVRLMANDIFRKNIARSNTTLGDLQLAFRGYYDSQRIRFQVSYKFGKLDSGVDNDNSTSDEFDRIKFD